MLCTVVGSRYLLWLLFVPIMGCCERRSDPVSVFRRKHPAEAKEFSYILPVRTEMYGMIYQMKSVTITGIGASLKAKFGSNPDVRDYADKILDQETNAKGLWEGKLAEYRKVHVRGSAICEYEWTDGKRTETGLLILHDGEILKREPWLTE